MHPNSYKPLGTKETCHIVEISGFHGQEDSRQGLFSCDAV